MIVLCASAVHAGSAWMDGPAFSTDTSTLVQAAREEEARSGARDGVVVLLAETTFVYDDQGRETRSDRWVYLLRTNEAVQAWGSSEVRWSPWYQARPELRVRVISADGTEHWVDGATLGDAAVSQQDPTVFSDDRVMRTPLPGVGVGAVVEEWVSVREEHPFLSGGAVRRVSLVGDPRPARRRVVVEVTGDLPLRHRLIHTDAQLRRLKGKGHHGIEVVLDDSPKWEGGIDFAPEDEPEWPTLEFSTAPDWPEVASAYHDLVAPKIDATGLEALVEEVDRAGTGREDKVAAAHRIARDRVRYTGVVFGQQAIVPYAPSTTIERGFGDCKDKATLMVSLLAGVGVEARLALLASRDGFGFDVPEDMPGASLFDHAIVYVPGEEPLWLDPTAELLPYDQLPWGDQGRLALVIDPSQGRLEHTPTTGAADNLYREERRVELPIEGFARVTERTVATGWPGLVLRWGFTDQDPEAIEEQLTSYGEETYNATAMTGMALENLDRYDQPMVVDVTYEDAQIGASSVVEAGVWVDPSVALTQVPEILTTPPGKDDPLAERTLPVVYAPFRSEVAYEVVLPEGYVPRALPESRVRRFGSATLEERFVVVEGALRATWSFDAGDARLSPEEARALREALVPWNDARQLLWDEKGALMRASGRIREALAHYDGLVEAHPYDGTYRALRATALLDAHLGELALEEAQRAAEISPDAPAVWRLLGLIQMHDRYGYELARDFDREGAIASTRRALKLDPSDSAAQQNLAVLLEYPEHGLRYGPGADLEGAVEAYRAYRAETGATDLDGNLLIALLHLGRCREAAELAAETDRTVTTDGLRLAALACDRGVDPALAEVGRWGWENAERLQVMNMARAMLIMLRRYPEAADMADATAGLSADPLVAHQSARLLRTVRPWQEVADEHGDDPTALFLRLVATIWQEERARELFARDLGDARGTSDAWGELARGFAMARAITAIPPDAIIDMLAATMMETDQYGDERAGLQMRVSCLTIPAFQFYAVREHGGLRIRAFQGDSALLGREAWTRARHGDVPGARQWLGWGLAELPGARPTLRTVLAPLLQESHRPGELRRIAAVLMAPTHPDDAIAELEPWRAEITDPDLAVQIDYALFRAGQSSKRWEVVLEAVDRLTEVKPQSEAVRKMEIRALLGAGRPHDALAAVGSYAEQFPDDLPFAAVAAQRAGDVERSRDLYLRAIADGDVQPSLANNLAWSLLFEPADLEKAEEYAILATAESPPKATALHTLATVLAQRGETDRATEVLGMALQPKMEQDPGDIWWLVIGRLALEYGYSDYARKAWAHIPESTDPISCRGLADEWLAALDAVEQP